MTYAEKYQLLIFFFIGYWNVGRTENLQMGFRIYASLFHLFTSLVSFLPFPWILTCLCPLFSFPFSKNAFIVWFLQWNKRLDDLILVNVYLSTSLLLLFLFLWRRLSSTRERRYLYESTGSRMSTTFRESNVFKQNAYFNEVHNRAKRIEK